MHNELERVEKIIGRINELASISEEKTCITRTLGTTAFLEGSRKVLGWMNEAGLQTSIDNIGNIKGLLPAANTQAKTLVIASHIDTVRNAGKFDGPLGVLMGLDMLEEIKKAKKQFAFHILLVAFSDEEGVRFHTTYLGSKVLAGSFDKDLLIKKDEKGISLQQVISEMGGNSEKIFEDYLHPDYWLGYFEIHIEQGPVLFENDIPVALVTSIAGQMRVELKFKGNAGHAGTVPMNMRQDALCAASEFIIELEKFAGNTNNNVVATVGKLNIPYSASNTIPAEVVCSLDLRSADENSLSFSSEQIMTFCESIGKKRNIDIEWNLIQQTKPVICDDKMSEQLELSIRNAGYPVLKLVSGAGHDGVAVSVVSPIAMLFVRCYKGISHNPLENVELKDLAAAIRVSDIFINRMSGIEWDTWDR